MSNYKSEAAVRILVCITIIGAVVLLGMITCHQQSRKMAFYRPVGYIKKVQQLIDEKLIEYDPKNEKISFAWENAPKQFRDFFNQSYLEDDIKAFNNGNYWGTFNIKDRKIVLDIRAHQVELPYSPLRTWTGKLKFRPTGTSAVLKNNDLHLQVVQTPRGVLPLHAKDYMMVPLNKKGLHSNYGFLLAYNDMSGYFAQVEYIGDNVVLEVKKSDPIIAVRNFKIPVGHNIRLDDEDIILFENYRGVRNYFIFRDKTFGSLISGIRNVNGRKRRMYLVDSLPMAEHLANGIQQIASFQESSQPEETFDMTLTIDRKLHERIQNELANFKWENGRMKNKYAPAGVTLIDINTGDILTLASYPDPSIMDSFKRSLRRESDSYVNRLRLNQNLLLHPIGSAGKPILASAIWAVHPFLAEYRITQHPAGSELNNTLGVDFDPPFDIFGHRENIDRRTFLKYSCNLYMVNLFHLALAVDTAGKLKFLNRKIPPHGSIAGRVIDRAVDIGLYLQPDKEILVNLPKSPVVEAIHNMFDVEVTAVGSNDYRENTAARYDTDILSSVQKRLFIEDAVALRPLYSACPEQVNLKFNQIQRLRSHLISLDLGGASSEWNNIKLAEAAARIVTRKKVKARLILDISEKNGTHFTEYLPEGFADFNDNEKKALDWVRAGIREPTTPGGTAELLVPEITRLNKWLEANNLRITVFSKTGSPRKERKNLRVNSAVYIFCILMEEKKGNQWSKAGGISGTIYIEDRGDATLAVSFAQKIFKHIVNYLKNNRL